MLFCPLPRDDSIVKHAADKIDIPVWRQPDGQPVSCVEKIKVLNENLAELQQMAQDALEDALLMGCDERQVREVLQRLMTSLENPYRKAEPRE
jgi:hypothetical protein